MKNKKMFRKNSIFALICLFVALVTSISFVFGSEGQEAGQQGGTQSEAAKPEKEYKLIEKTKDYMLSPKETFLYYCSPCHGKTGNGKGIYFTIDLKPAPANLTNVEYMAALTDDYLFNFITQGSAAMEKSKLCPPWGNTLDEGTLWGIIGYIRSLSAAKTEEGGEASDKEDAAEVASEEKEKGTPQAVIWSVLAFLCAFFAIGARREWRKLAEEGASGKK